MKRKQITAWVLIGTAVGMLALWGYARTGWDHTVRLQLVLQGLPFSEVRADPVGSRPNGHDHNIAYRRSVYSRGEYVGYIQRFGQFIRPGDDLGNPTPLLVAYAVYSWAQYFSAIMFGFAVLLFWKSMKTKRSQQIGAR